MLQEIEAALVKKLEKSLAGADLKIKVKAFPEDLRELKQPAIVGQVLLAYKRSTFRQLQLDPLIDEQLLQFDITSTVRGLRTHEGAYPLLDEIRFSIGGWYSGSSAQKRPAYFSDERFVGVEERNWTYNQTLIVPLQITAGQRPEFSAPDLPDPYGWENLEQIQVTVGLWRSPSDRLSEAAVSTKDAEVKIILDQ
jgi:Gp37 protein